jgi:hypothetical protein
MNFFGGPDNSPATGANILPGSVLLAGTLQAGDPWPNKGKTRFPKALNKFKGFRVQGCFVPSVLIAFFHRQAVGFSGFPELLVVVQARTGSVLNTILKILKVNHFVKQGSTGFFKGPVQVFGTQIDFIVAFILASFPSLPAGTPSIGPTGMIRGNGNHGLFQLVSKEPGVEL